MRSMALYVDFNMAGNRSETDLGKKGKDKDQSHFWNDEEVKVLLEFFSEETIQFSLEKAQCPKDKNAVYHNIQVKLENQGKHILVR